MARQIRWTYSPTTLSQQLVADLAPLAQAVDELNLARRAYQEQKKAIEAQYASIELHVQIVRGVMFFSAVDLETQHRWGTSLDVVRALGYPLKIEPDSKVLRFDERIETGDSVE